MREITTKVYSYKELSDKAKERALLSAHSSNLYASVIESETSDDFDSLEAFFNSLDSIIVCKSGDHYGSLVLDWNYTQDWCDILDGEYDLELVPQASDDGQWLSCFLREDWNERIAPINDYIEEAIAGGELDLNHLREKLTSAIDDIVDEAADMYNTDCDDFSTDERVEEFILAYNLEFTEDGECASIVTSLFNSRV